LEISTNEKLAFEAAMLETHNAKNAWNKLLQLEELKVIVEIRDTVTEQKVLFHFVEPFQMFHGC
jgi:hypothetical protein